MSVFYQCRFCGICFSFQRYFCHGRIVSNSLRRFGIGSVSQVRIQKEEIRSPRIFEKKIHKSAQVERWRRARERSDEAESTTKGRAKGEGEKRMSRKHDQRHEMTQTMNTTRGVSLNSGASRRLETTGMACEGNGTRFAMIRGLLLLSQVDFAITLLSNSY